MAVVALLMAGCSGGLVSNGTMDGRTRVFEEGIPEFDLEALALPDYPEDSILVNLGLIPATLVFSATGHATGHALIANLRYEIRVDGDLSLEAVDSIGARDGEQALSFRRQTRTHRLARTSGRGRVEVVVEDMASGRRAVRRQDLWNASSEAVDLYPVRLADSGGPVVSLDVASGWTRLRFEVTAMAREQGCLVAALVSIPTDTTAATLPYGLAPSFGSTQHRGALYDRADTLATWKEPVGPGLFNGVWPIGQSLPLGVYHADVAWQKDCRGGSLAPPDPAARRAPVAPPSSERPFVVRPSNFPRVNRLDQLIDGLQYLAGPEELAAIREVPSPAGRREAFDAFWGRTIGDPEAAAQAIGRYYGRMEEANRAFSAFKEGWKTDRGMVYMVMGPPLYTENSVEQLRWFYSYDDRDSGRYFVFQRVRGHPDAMDLPHYVLLRSSDQEREWRLAVQRWRRGSAR